MEKNSVKKLFRRFRIHNDELSDDKKIDIYLTAKNNLQILKLELFNSNYLTISAKLRIEKNLLNDLNAIDIESLNVISLNLSNLGLITLTPLLIDEFSGLKSLNLSNNHLTELPQKFLIKLTKLEKLDLSNNNFQNLKWSDFENLYKLKDLYLDNNSLSEEFKDKIILFNLLYLPKLRIHFE